MRIAMLSQRQRKLKPERHNQRGTIAEGKSMCLVHNSRITPWYNSDEALRPVQTRLVLLMRLLSTELGCLLLTGKVTINCSIKALLMGSGCPSFITTDEVSRVDLVRPLLYQQARVFRGSRPRHPRSSEGVRPISSING